MGPCQHCNTIGLWEEAAGLCSAMAGCSFPPSARTDQPLPRQPHCRARPLPGSFMFHSRAAPGRRKKAARQRERLRFSQRHRSGALTKLNGFLELTTAAFKRQTHSNQPTPRGSGGEVRQLRIWGYLEFGMQETVTDAFFGRLHLKHSQTHRRKTGFAGVIFYSWISQRALLFKWLPYFAFRGLNILWGACWCGKWELYFKSLTFRNKSK